MFDLENRDILRSRYESASSKALFDIEQSQFWGEMLAELPEMGDRYLLTTRYPLLVTKEPPKLLRKSFRSLFIKSFRLNVLANKNWPDPPDDGWCEPNTWLATVSDVIRTMVVVKYLDGVTYLAEQLVELATAQGLFSRVNLEAREEGYYAAHFYWTQDVEVPKANWDTQIVPLSVEVQITTQLQETILRLTHENYESRRMRPDSPSVKWQWDFMSQEFVPNYLGHILHYLEGMIMEVRDRPRERNRTSVDDA